MRANGAKFLYCSDKMVIREFGSAPLRKIPDSLHEFVRRFTAKWGDLKALTKHPAVRMQLCVSVFVNFSAESEEKPPGAVIHAGGPGQKQDQVHDA